MSGIVVTDQAFGGVERERALADRLGVPFADHRCTTEEETIEVVRGADVVIVNFAPITRRVLEELADGATVIRYGIGYDNVDTAAAQELGVAVCNVPDYGADTVADHTVASLLALLRRLKQYDSAVRGRGWLSAGDLGPIRGFAETTVGLVGTGRIGRAVAERLRPFGFRIVASDPFVSAEQLAPLGIELLPFERVLEQAHAVSLHVPLTAENQHLMDAAAFGRMTAGAVLVNTSRGGLIDTAALVAALQDGPLAAAALDVFEEEPLAADSPLRSLENAVLTPHAAFFSDTSLAALQRLATEEAERALLGQPLRCRVA